MFRAPAFMGVRLGVHAMLRGIPRGPGFGERQTTLRGAVCALLAAVAFAPLPAAAQQQDHALSRAEILDTTTVENQADMDFGDIIPGTADGSVVMTANANGTATCTTNFGIVHTGNCQAARFDGTIPFIYALEVTGPPGDQVTLVGPAGATMVLRRFRYFKGTPLMFGGSTENPTYFVLGGTFILYVGGTLDVARTQRPGIYNGTFELTFNYN